MTEEQRSHLRAELRETLEHLERLQERQFSILEPLLRLKEEFMDGLTRLNAAIDTTTQVSGQLATYITTLQNAAGGDNDADVNAAAARLEEVNAGLAGLIPLPPPPPQA